VSKRRKRKEEAIKIVLPITPMLDMSFQLLSFFILTFHPAPQEGQFSMTLPKPDASNAPTNMENISDDEKKDEYKVISVSNNGALAFVTFSGPGRNDDKQLSLDGLAQELASITKPQNVTITIECDNDLIYSNLISIMNVCKSKGFESVGISPKTKR
jgi:biopolymer transport protein ExbD